MLTLVMNYLRSAVERCSEEMGETVARKLVDRLVSHTLKLEPQLKESLQQVQDMLNSARRADLKL